MRFYLSISYRIAALLLPKLVASWQRRNKKWDNVCDHSQKFYGHLSIFQDYEKMEKECDD